MTKESTAVAIKGTVTNAEERASRVGQGSENVRASDLAIPRIKVLQPLSPEVQKSHAQYVEGAETGMMMNSLNSELFNAAFVINLHYDRKVVVWKKRKFGGGMFGAFETEAEAQAALAEAGEQEAQFDIVDNPTHLVLLLSDDGEPKGVALLDMPGTKAKVSRRWNSLIAEQEQAGNPRFGCVWELKSVSESNQHGSYSNFDVDFVVIAPDEIYAAAQAAFDAFFGGRAEAA
ncbi:hypothetical protein HNR62_000347 [Oceanisphaera litoralis]|uniref:hypothetical protein n=1 Tax=Oceanisphaera litoralis TaxID=225144 RepID=UPI00195C9809|nr:hypothetical protein [Oceanisphaera litoralis]MBM7454518.1 hypothetical protein [Oceanisphaera litoralis]